MTTIELYDYAPRTWESMTVWLDGIIAENQTDHQMMIEICDSLQSLFDELYYMQEDTPAWLTPANQVLSHRLQLRLDDIDEVIDGKFRTASLRKSAEAWLAILAAEAVGPLTDEDRVVFETTAHWQHNGLLGYVRSALVESAHAAPSSWLFHSGPVVVITPRWAHRYLTALSMPGEEGVAHRSKLFEGVLAQDPLRAPGDAIPVPSEDVLETALALWCPSDEKSPYGEFGAAIAAAERICAR
jgi:hypothetical protein